MKALKRIGLLAVVVAAFAGGYFYKAIKAGSGASGEKGGRKVLYWVDPMHPAYKSDAPGIAPDCGMTLEPVYADEAARPEAGGGQKVLYYRDPKQPDYMSDKPGLNPKTGNRLEPVYARASEPQVPAGAIK